MDASNASSQNTSSVGESDPAPDFAGAAKLSAALSSSQRTVINELVQPNGNVPRAAEKAGVHRGTVNRWMLSDADFIAALNARLLEIETANSAKLAALIPKALQAIEDAIDNGDARLAMQLLKAWMNAPKHARVLSAATIAEQLKVDEQRQQVAAIEKQVKLAAQEEALHVERAAVDKTRQTRIYNAKSTFEQYEDSRRWHYTARANTPDDNAKLKEIDARVRTEVEQMMAERKKREEAAKLNPTSSTQSSTAKNPGTPTSAAETKSWKATTQVDPRVAAAAQKLVGDLSNPGASPHGLRGE